MKNRKQLLYTFLLIIGVMALVNILSVTFFARLDFTADKRYTLSKATKDILKELKSPVTITAYFSKDLPPDLVKTRRDFNELLVEYSNRSNGKVKFEFIEPSNDETEQKAQQAGIQPVIVNVREKDQVKQQKAYLGAVIKIAERTEIIPLVQPGAAMEYALSSSIKKLSVVSKPTVGIIQGHGEPQLNAIHQAYQSLDVLYSVQPVYMTDTTNALQGLKTVALIAPKDSISANQLAQLDQFIANGGNLFVAFNVVDGNLQQAMGEKVPTNVGSWLKKRGINVEESFVVDANCGTVGVQQPQFGYVVQMKFPYLPIINNFPEHPVTQGLEAVVFQFVSPITYTGDNSYKFEPLAVTSEQSGKVELPLTFDVNKQWTTADLPLKGIIIAGALTPANPKLGKIVVVSNGNFAVNGDDPQQGPQQLNPDNVNLFVNAIDWMSDDTGLIDLRTKGITARMLDQISDGKKAFLKYFNFLFPIILIIGYGVLRFNQRRNLRIKRMEARYV